MTVVSWSDPARACAAVALLLLGGCDAMPRPHARIVGALPSGTVAADALRIAFTASEPFDASSAAAAGLCHEEDLAQVKRAAESGSLDGARTLTARVDLTNGGRTLEIVPGEPLVPGRAYAAILASGARAADGRTVLDAEGRARAVVVEFTVSPVLAGPVRAEITRVLADAATPEAGGEYVEVTNLAAAPLDLAGFTLLKRGATGSFTRCSIERSRGGAIAPGARGLVAGGAYDGRYSSAARLPLYRCGAAAVAGGLANDRPPALLLEDPAGAVVSSIGVAAAAPLCEGTALVRLDASGPDAIENLSCAPDVAPEVDGVAAGPAGVR